MKVPVLVTLLLDLERSGGHLSAREREDAGRALEQSDNAAAEELFSVLEQRHGGLVGASAAVQRTLREAGDRDTTINTRPNRMAFTTWGQSEWSATGEVLFYRALARGCLTSAGDTDYVLSLMRQVTGSQRWGIGAAGFPSGTPVAFKGGWGPESDQRYLVRQTAVVGSGEDAYVISLIVHPDRGSFTGAVQDLTAAAQWARGNLALDYAAPASRCGQTQPRRTAAY
jgi:Beta-lactamase enzyme family